MRLYPFHPSSPVVRLSVRPDHDDPAAIVRRAGPRQPHTDATVAAVRRLIEQSTLNYRQIAARTGVSINSISKWTRDGGWKRPPFAPRACDTIPTPRATAKLQRRMLGARLQALAERHVRELEESAGAEPVDPVKLGEALELLNMARLAAQPRRRPKRRPGEMEPVEAFRPIAELCIGGVTLSRAPRAAVEDFLANRARPPEQDLPPRGSRRSRRWREQARMREKCR
jgi:transcriptional regulator with XRE-family HTH domain